MTEHVRRELTDGIVTLTIAGPDKKNALDEAIYAALSDGLELTGGCINLTFACANRARPRLRDVRAWRAVARGFRCALRSRQCGCAARRPYAKARRAAETLAKPPAGSLSHTKSLMRETERIASQISRERTLFGERLQSAEAREALAAFAERWPPDFSRLFGRN